MRALKQELERDGIKSPERVSLKGRRLGGVNFSRGALYAILKNPAYIGKISHKDQIYEGLHEGIVPLDVWETEIAKRERCSDAHVGKCIMGSFDVLLTL